MKERCATRKEAITEQLSYLDFEVKIIREGKNFGVRVLRSPSGEASNAFELPFSQEKLENLVLKLSRLRGSTRRIHSAEMEAARELGGKLFERVFGGEVRACLRSSLEEARRKEGMGLRIKLRLQEVSDLADIPWEFLLDTSFDRFLAQSNQTPVVRYIEMPEPIKPLTASLPLHMLVMISSPADHIRLDVERERSLLQKALDPLSKRGKVRVEWLEHGTLKALQRRLRVGAYHIFHFIGHGGFDKKTEEGVLVLEDEQAKGCLAGAHMFGTFLYDHRSLRLVVLNSCEGARNSVTDPFAGMATGLIRQGIPAVVAMQFEISDDAAITFAEEFYSAIVDGFPVDAAMAEARKAIYAQPNDVEWGTPVLYMRSPDGVLFRLVDKPTLVEETQETPVPEKEEIRTTDLLEANEACASGKENYAAGDYESAIRLFQEAAKAGNADAMYNLGSMYENGQGVETDEREAVRWYRKAAEAGDATAMNSLGFMYDNGTGIEKNEKEAMHWYREAAEAGNADAMYNLGVMHEYGQGIETDEREAMRWFSKAAEVGNTDAMYYLGVMHEYGKGVEIDEKEAVRWYRKAAEAGNATAMNRLGLMYENGTGIERNYKEARRWYREAADMRDTDAMYNLGLMYEHGKGIDVDEREAVRWFRKAAEAGDSDAMEHLKELGE